MKISRRAFLRLMAAGAGGAAAFLLSPLPSRLASRFVRANQTGPLPLHQGKEEKIQTVICRAQNAIPAEVRLVDGIARQILPIGKKNPHPLGGRGIIGLAAAEIQNLTRPSRITAPLVRKNGKLEKTSWEEALALLRQKFFPAGGSIACVTGEPGSVGAALLYNLLKQSDSSDFFPLPGQRTAAEQALQLLGIDGEPAYDIPGSTCVLSVGADWLESWGPSYYWRNKIFEQQGRPEESKNSRPGMPGRHIYCGPYQNATALHSGAWLPLKPGEEEAFLLALGCRLLARGLPAKHPDTLGTGHVEVFSQIFTDERALEATKACGIPQTEINRVAEQLAGTPRPLVITGSALGVDQKAHLHILGFCLNLMLGSCFKPGGFHVLPRLAPPAPKTDFPAWVASIAGKENPPPKLLIFHECNPAYTLAPGTGVAHPAAQKTLESIPFKVALGVYENETTEICDLVLPISASIERWEQIYCPVGECGYFSIQPPAILPPPQIPCVAGLLAALSGSGLEEAKASSPHPLEQKLFKQSSQKMLKVSEKNQKNEWFWIKGQEQPASLIPTPDLLKKILCDKKNLLSGEIRPEEPTPGLRLAPLAFNEHLDFTMGLSSFRSWPLFSKACEGKLIIARLNPAEAKRLRLSSGDEALIVTPERKIKALVVTDHALTEGCLGIHAGFGHTGGDQFSKGLGENLFMLYELGQCQPGFSHYRQRPVKLETY